MYPISDLTAFCRQTTGDVPPKLVGASTTVVGSKMYLYGGRLVSERKMVSDIFMFDLETFKWEKVVQSNEDDIPQARYFHSADTWRNHLIVFGGMAIKPQSDNPEDLCVLNDVRLFDLTSRHWLPPAPIAADSSLVPNARYAHLSSVTADRLFIIGGQDLANVWLDDVYIFDLVAKTWIQRRDYPRHCGTYRSVAVTSHQRVRLPQEELRGAQSISKLGQPGTRFNLDGRAPAASNATESDALIHLPYSAAPTDDYPCDVFLFSNYNFTDVQRELEVFTPLSDGDFTVSDRSSAMTGTSFPPGLRFPTGAILGTFFIVAGTYLSQTYQSFSIWALDLINMTWSRIDPGSALSSGSWFRSCLWASANKFVVFGNRHGNLVEDYNRRLLSWDHVTCIDLEAFGIYQPPPLYLDIPMQELGLAALEEGLMVDFEVVCDDGRRIKVSRKLLEDRWPWFKEQRKLFLQAASRALEAMPLVPSHTAPPELPNANRQEQRPDPRLTSRAFNLSEPYPITLAFMQYFYSMSLITPLQHAPAVLSQLLLLSSTYQLTHLQSLVKHAMHRALSYATSVGIYGVSTLCSCRSLQIRALRVVMAYSQRRPTGVRSRTDKDGGASGGQNPDGSGGSGGNGRLDQSTAARPRGMSDASYMRGVSEGSSSTPRGFVRGTFTADDFSPPLAVLADLQEFGLVGLELPIPQTHHVVSKRMSNASMILPPLNEEPYTDNETLIELSLAAPGKWEGRLGFLSERRADNLPARAPPPTAPLPSIPLRPKRMSSLDTPAPPDDSVLLKSVPVSRPKSVASMDTIYSQSSFDSPRFERGQVSSFHRSLPPSPRASVMSLSTEQDLYAIVDMLSPSVNLCAVEEEPIPDAQPMAELEPFPDMFPDQIITSNAFKDSPGPAVRDISSVYSVYGRQSIRPRSRSMQSSKSTDSDGVSYYSDDVPDIAHLTRLREGFHEAQLRGSLPLPLLDDSRSIASSGSYNTPRTPSLSRTPSLTFFPSPPVSPSSFGSPGEVSGSSSPPFVGLSGIQSDQKLLGIVEEVFQSDGGRYQRRHTTAGTGATRLDDSYFPHRHGITSGPRSPVNSLHHDLSRTDLRPDSRSRSRSESRAGTRSSSALSHRLADLRKLQISETPSPSPTSAPAPELRAISPFSHSRPATSPASAHPRLRSHRSQRPSYAERRAGYILDEEGMSIYPGSDDEHSSYIRASQSLFGQLRTAYSDEHLSTAPVSSESHLRSSSPAGKLAQIDETQPPTFVTLEPAFSPSLECSSPKTVVRSPGGFGKLFKRNSTMKKSTEGSIVFPVDGSMSSVDLTLCPKTGGKRAKKEAAKARTERLAQDLAEKTRRRVEAAKGSGSLVKDKAKTWEENGGMYEGMSYF